MGGAPGEAQPSAMEVEGGGAAALEWVYLDGDGIEQGPFPQSLMAQWYAKGALPEELPVRTFNSTRFTLLSEVVERW